MCKVMSLISGDVRLCGQILMTPKSVSFAFYRLRPIPHFHSVFEVPRATLSPTSRVPDSGVLMRFYPLPRATLVAKTFLLCPLAHMFAAPYTHHRGQMLLASIP